MTAAAKSPDLIKLPVTRLALGMYVTAVDQNGKLTVVNAGLLKHKDAITHLQGSGIKFVWVDTEKSLRGSGLKKVVLTGLGRRMTPGQVSGAADKSAAPSEASSRQRGHEKAKNLLCEAKSLT